ncbi:DUF6891 domain-containing protein [Propionicicella superfundia]|uniref:DUF6891 domain-containing protein n=1 Tax=Propionicicella superfundia TaxID=348582 RepID=UPI00040920E2|nr:hypothetical protein [Propionicicella superfundia]
MWKYYEQPDGLRLPSSYGLTPSEEEALRTRGWQLLLRGEDDGYLLGEYATERIGTPLTDDEVDQLAAFLRDARRAQQAQWAPGEPGPTPLSRAFAVLEQHNVLARENFACCLDCASGEIVGEFDDSRTWLGAVYYHGGDTADIIENGHTHLAYGVRLPAFFTAQDWNALSGAEQQEAYEKLTVSLVKQVVIPILLEHGIDVDWTESIEDRLRLSNVTYLARV